MTLQYNETEFIHHANCFALKKKLGKTTIVAYYA